ncbi:hypothetical protein CDAR_517691 [Caerostris darwini]|uniref:Uncharacterized protein n=1 Tax=Caerostris darwini TaxID=1538125 RepID=A0AAV4SC37_9ARAC|nr:hypothetical protein CDAR_517691 [Caerostris darwini]
MSSTLQCMGSGRKKKRNNLFSVEHFPSKYHVRKARIKVALTYVITSEAPFLVYGSFPFNELPSVLQREEGTSLDLKSFSGAGSSIRSEGRFFIIKCNGSKLNRRCRSLFFEGHRKVHAYVQQKVHHDLMISGGKSVSELDNSREDHSSVPFLGGGGGWRRGRHFVELSN